MKAWQSGATIYFLNQVLWEGLYRTILEGVLRIGYNLTLLPLYIILVRWVWEELLTVLDSVKE